MSDDLPLILVNEQDEPIGIGEKLAVHQEGLLHRAFSIFIYNTQGELLLQQRAVSKYHSPNLWTNTCCGHATPSETIEESASRRLMEEMGMSAHLVHSFALHYIATIENTLVENEIDHVFIGMTDDLPSLNPDEAQNYRHAPMEQIVQELALHPEFYTAWFRIIIEQHLSELSPSIAL